jgi:hypothetical protein
MEKTFKKLPLKHKETKLIDKDEKVLIEINQLDYCLKYLATKTSSKNLRYILPLNNDKSYY